MSKKTVAALLALCFVLGGGVVYIRISADRTKPKISFSSAPDVVYDENITQSELLNGVTAEDDRDGDVSDSLRIGSVYDVDDTHVAVEYTARDSANNIAKGTRTMEAEPGADEPDTDEKDPEQESGDSQEESGESEASEDNPSADPAVTEAAEESEEAEDETDGDEASRMKEEQVAEADAMPSSSPRIYLTDYYITVSAGTSLSTENLLSYVDTIEDDQDSYYDLSRKIQISGNVDTSAAGTYTCTFYVVDSAGNTSNNAVLTIVVE